jgi:hypothetical protein
MAETAVPPPPPLRPFPGRAAPMRRPAEEVRLGSIAAFHRPDRPLHRVGPRGARRVDQGDPAAAAACDARHAGHRAGGGPLLLDFVVTVWRTVEAFLIAAVVGVPLGVLLGSNERPTAASSSPFGLRYRSLVLLLRGGCSLREAASGYAPDRAVTFFRFPERKSPKKGGPDGGGRPRADCSAVLGVWGLAPNSLRVPAFTALRQTREVS